MPPAWMLLGLLALSPAAALEPPPPGSPAVCHDMSAFRSMVLAKTTAAERNAILNWRPPKPVGPAEKSAVARMALQYLEACGLEDILALTSELVRFPTVRTRGGVPGAPFLEMLETVKRWARDADLAFEASPVGDLWEISLGFGDPSLLLLTHADVAPASDAARHPSFTAEEVRGRLHGRGTEDDKAAIAAALVMLRTLSQMGLRPKGKIVLVVVTSEAGRVAAVARYGQVAKGAVVLALDGVFPLGIAESAFATWGVGAPQAGASKKPMRPAAVAAQAGDFDAPWSVPDEAVLVLRGGPAQSGDALRAQLDAAVARELLAVADPRLSIQTDLKGTELTVRVRYADAALGKPAVIFSLARLLRPLEPAPNGLGALLGAVATLLAGEPSGERLGLAARDALMGPLVVVPSALRLRDDEAELRLLLRLPRGLSEGALKAKLAEALRRLQRLDPNIHEVQALHYQPPWESRADSGVALTLLKVYERHTGQVGKPRAVLRRTLASAFPNGLSFGPQLPGRARTAEDADESIDVHDLQLFAQMLLHATLKLEFGRDV
jgi:dipeptidase D